MLKVGLTGGIGSGKSTVCQLFADHGVPIIDTDELARHAVAPDSPALVRITESFGSSVLNEDGSLNRPKLREIVFHDPALREELETIVHPQIRMLLQQQLATIVAPYVIIAIPLLFEKQWQDRVDRILVVDCEESLQLERTMLRDNSDEKTIRAILAAQLPRQKRLEHADDIIHNDADLAALRQQVDALHQFYTGIVSD